MSHRYPPRSCKAAIWRRAACAVAAAWLASAVVSAQVPTKDANAAAVAGETAKEPTGFLLVEGQITGSTGVGLKGVTVALHRAGDDPTVEQPLATADTNEVGDFSIRTPQAMAGKFLVSFRKDQFAEHREEIEVEREGQPPFIGVTLSGNLSIVGRVVDALTRAAIANAAVQVKSQAEERSAKTDGEGRFRVSGLSAGEAELFFESAGFGREKVALSSIEGAGELTVELKPERVVRVTVVDEGGAIVEGAIVECYDKVRDDFRSTITDDQGACVLRGVHFDARGLAFRLEHADHVSDARFDRPIELPNDEKESAHRLVMTRAGRITGRVIEAGTKTPLSGARVVVGDVYSDDAPRDWSDHEGHFIVIGVAPGPAVITVHRSDFGPELKRVDVRAGESSSVDVELDKPSTITGVVNDRAGQPVPEIEVRATRWRGAGTLGLRAVTDANGRFQLRDAPRDPFELSVDLPSRDAVTVTVNPADAKPVELVLPDARPEGNQGSAGLRIGETIPPLTLTSIDGTQLNLVDFKNKIVLVNFWATWCPPCLEELRTLVKIHERHGGRSDFLIVGISRDFTESDLRAYSKSNPQLKWPLVYGESGANSAARQVFAVGAIPRIFIFGKDGKLASVDLRGDPLIAKIDELLGGGVGSLEKPSDE